MTYFLEIYQTGRRQEQWKQEYWKNDVGKFHREEGPARIIYNEYGSVDTETWIINDECHRTNGPSYVKYYKNGNIRESRWIVNGDYHRIDGPAYIEYDMEGNVTYKDYWINDCKITDVVQKIFGDVPNELTKDQIVLLKLSLPEECFIE